MSNEIRIFLPDQIFGIKDPRDLSDKFYMALDRHLLFNKSRDLISENTFPLKSYMLREKKISKSPSFLSSSRLSRL